MSCRPPAFSKCPTSPPPSNIASWARPICNIAPPWWNRYTSGAPIPGLLFELAKRMGMSEQFFNGDIEAGYAYELAPTGITLEELKNTPGGISRPVAPTYRETRQDK